MDEGGVMTPAQKRLVDIIRSYDDCAEYWPVVNDWVKDKGPAGSLAFRNQERTVAALLRSGVVTIEDGLFRLTERAKP